MAAVAIGGAAGLDVQERAVGQVVDERPAPRSLLGLGDGSVVTWGQMLHDALEITDKKVAAAKKRAKAR